MKTEPVAEVSVFRKKGAEQYGNAKIGAFLKTFLEHNTNEKAGLFVIT